MKQSLQSYNAALSMGRSNSRPALYTYHIVRVQICHSLTCGINTGPIICARRIRWIGCTIYLIHVRSSPILGVDQTKAVSLATRNVRLRLRVSVGVKYGILRVQTSSFQAINISSSDRVRRYQLPIRRHVLSITSALYI
jgi:hypothetical protein